MRAVPRALAQGKITLTYSDTVTEQDPRAAILRDVKKGDGQYLVNGVNLTGFKNAEDTEIELLGQHLQGIGKNPRAAVGSRAQANDLRAEFDSAVIAVMRNVVQRDMNRHGGLLLAWTILSAAQDLCQGSDHAPARPARQPTHQKQAVHAPESTSCTI